VLAAGGLVAFPTETVYGLGADAGSDQAVSGIFAAKGRPSDHPLIVHVSDAAAVPRFAAAVPPVAQRLMQAFWPGPLTLILPRRPEMGRAAAGGQDSIGLRCPAHPVAHALLLACAQATPPVLGLAGPSANRFGRVSPTTAAHVASEFDESLLVLDGGATPAGIESIVDCTRVASRSRCGPASHPQPDRSGLRRAPRPPENARCRPALRALVAPAPQGVWLMDARSLQSALDVLGLDAGAIAVYARARCAPARRTTGACRTMRSRRRGSCSRCCASSTVWRQADLIETPPDNPDWDGVRDRLRRASAGWRPGTKPGLYRRSLNSPVY
jgi:L-threonylcarbamoyladenylate synthase